MGQSRAAPASQASPEAVPRPWAKSKVGGNSRANGLTAGPSQSLKPCTTTSTARANRAWRGSRVARQRRLTSTITAQAARASLKWASQARGRGRRLTSPK